MRRSVRAQGYILVETIVALLVLALVLGTTLSAIATSVRQQRRVADTRLALLVARSALASVGSAVPLAPGTAGGTDPGGFVWRVTIEPQGVDLARIRVAAGRAGAPASARLTTLRLAPGIR